LRARAGGGRGKKKVAVIFGTRPEAIKLAPVVLELRRTPGICTRVCVTAQHRSMLDQVLKDFALRPDTDLDLMRPDQTLAGLTAGALQALDAYLAREKPDLVLAQGDTTTVLCAALASFYRRVPFGHVEAGLRSGDLRAPWPEEANRVLATRIAALHFAPTAGARANLLAEGVPPASIFVTGNTVIDAMFLALRRIAGSRPAVPGLPESVLGGRLVLITGHRRENFGEGFESICRAVAALAARFPAVRFVYPVHLNPNVLAPVRRILGGPAGLSNVHLIEPLSYLPFVRLMQASTLILTDSGGVQEEAPSLGKPVLVMREVTERPEAVQAGTVRLVGSGKARIVAAVSKLLTDEAEFHKMARAHNPYGDGKSAGRIVRHCLRFLK